MGFGDVSTVPSGDWAIRIDNRHARVLVKCRSNVRPGIRTFQGQGIRRQAQRVEGVGLDACCFRGRY